MTGQPNILFLMTDQMQGRVLGAGHPCRTPHLDRLAGGGMRFERAYTPNAVCSPARASLMTGLLPHNHGVLQVTHCGDPDQNVLREARPHWGQILQRHGYRTGYFGKWHVDHADRADRYGWQVHVNTKNPPVRGLTVAYRHDRPPGYNPTLLYGVTDVPVEERYLGLTTAAARKFLKEATGGPAPWCCFVSSFEPHDPFICGKAAWAQYEVDALELPPNVHDDLSGRPGLYRKAARVWDGMTDRQRREAMACYYGSISEIDQQYGLLIEQLRDSGQLENTIIVLTSDHGELLGAHGLYTKNIHAGEEVYNIPMILAGPGITPGAVTGARVGLHDLYPTLLELAGLGYEAVPDSRSFAPLLGDPQLAGQYTGGYAEYFGGRIFLTQRIVWEGPWKYIFNGFDEDELYHLEADPYEMTNLIDDPRHQERVRQMCRRMWLRAQETGDQNFVNTHYASYRLAPVGPC